MKVGGVFKVRSVYLCVDEARHDPIYFDAFRANLTRQNLCKFVLGRFGEAVDLKVWVGETGRCG